MKNKEYNLFVEICEMLEKYSYDPYDNNHNNFVDQVHGKWAKDEAYPQQIIMSKNNITIVWSDGFRDKYPRH